MPKAKSVLTFLALLGDGGGRQQAEDEGDEQQGGGRPAASRRRDPVGRAPGHRRHVPLNAPPHQPTGPAASRSAYSPPHPRRDT